MNKGTVFISVGSFQDINLHAWVSHYWSVKPSWILLQQETMKVAVLTIVTL